LGVRKDIKSVSLISKGSLPEQRKKEHWGDWIWKRAVKMPIGRCVVKVMLLVDSENVVLEASQGASNT